MYPQHTDFSQPTSNPPKTTPNSQSTSTNNSTNSTPQSSLPCGQRTPAASTSSSDVPSSQTPPQTFATSHQPKIPTNTQHTSPSLHRQLMKTPRKQILTSLLSLPLQEKINSVYQNLQMVLG